MFLTALQFTQALESAILADLRAHEGLQDKTLSSQRFLDFNKNSVSLELVLSLKDAPSKTFKAALDVQRISAEAEAQSAFSLRFRAPEWQKDRLSLVKTKDELDREVKLSTLFFKYYFLAYLAQAQVPNVMPLEGSLESHLEKALKLS